MSSMYGIRDLISIVQNKCSHHEQSYAALGRRKFESICRPDKTQLVTIQIMLKGLNLYLSVRHIEELLLLRYLDTYIEQVDLRHMIDIC
jgi:hypothetical protein